MRSEERGDEESKKSFKDTVYKFCPTYEKENKQKQ